MIHEDRDLRRRTRRYALQIVRLYTRLPGTAEAQVLGKQILRSGTSVGANYAEAFRARSGAEFIAKLGISVQELEETLYWLDLLVEAEIVSDQHELRDETNQLIAIFTSSIKTRKANLREAQFEYNVT